MALKITLSSVTNGTIFGFNTINGVIGGNATINWGDGTNSTITAGVSNYTIDHTYTSVYSSVQIQITGTTVQQIAVNNAANLVTSVDSFGNIGIQNLQLNGCTGLTTNCVPNAIPTTMTNLTKMFYNCASFNDPTILYWDVSAVTNTSQMFQGAVAFDQSIANWNVILVSNMTNMFSNSVSVTNMDQTLIAWAALPTLTRSVTLSNIRYSSNSQSAFNTLASKYNWTITGIIINTSKLTSSFTPTSVSYAVPIAVSPAGNYYVQGASGSNSIYVYDSSGTSVTTITASDRYNSFAIDPSANKMYCAGNTTFGTLNLANNSFSTVSTSAPLSGCAFWNGSVYATTVTGYIVKQINVATPTSQSVFFTASGNILADTYNSFSGCATDGANYLYCMTRGTGFIYRFNIRNSSSFILLSTLNVSPLYGYTFGLTCDLSNNLYFSVGGATSTTYASPGAVYRVSSTVLVSLLASTSYSSYGVFYNQTTDSLIVSDQKTVYNCSVSTFTTTQNVNDANIFAYYPFDLNGANHGSKYRNYLSPSMEGGVSVSSKAYSSIKFTGVSNQGFKLDNITFTNTGLTFATWMRCNAIPTADARIFDFGDPSNNYNFYLECPSNGSISLGVKSPSIGTAGLTSLNYTIRDLNWHHYALTISSTGVVYFYVDGYAIPTGITANIYPTLTTLTNCYLANIPNVVNGYLNAYMNQTLVFYRDLTSTEIGYLINPAYFALSSFPSGATPSTTDSYSNPPVPYGMNSSFQLTYSSPFLVTNRSYVLKDGSTILDTNTYNGYYEGDSNGDNTVTCVVVDGSRNAWCLTNGGIKRLKINPSDTTVDYTQISFPVNIGQVLARVRYYNGLIYGVGYAYYTSVGYFFTMNPTTRTLTNWFASGNIKYHYNDIAISKSGIGYMSAGDITSNSTIPGTYQWQIDTIDLSTLQITPLISGTYASFQIGTTSVDYILSVVLDSNEDLYVLTKSSYLTKWSKSGTQLMAPRKLVDSSGVSVGSQMDIDTATNDLYIFGNGIVKINTTNWTTTAIIYNPSYINRSLCIDNNQRIIYFNGAQNKVVRLDLSPIPTIKFDVTLANVTSSTLLMEDASGNSFGVQIYINGIYPCFLQGSKILKLDPETDDEYYVPVETLRRGDLIKTATCGYKAVAFIGRGTLRNPTDDPDKKNRLYKFQDARKKHPPLYITGEHCLLYKEKEISAEKRREVREHMGDDYITETYHRIPACLDDKGSPYDKYEGPVTIWHFALEHNNLYNNYAVWANGILVETCSIDFLLKKSSLELVDAS